MGHWGVRSYETDEAHDALDAAFDQVHGPVYEDLMSDRNPLELDQIQERLANQETLNAALDWLVQEHGEDRSKWVDEARLAFCGVIVRHAECGTPLPNDVRTLALNWLDHEELEWDLESQRDKRRNEEISLLRGLNASS